MSIVDDLAPNQSNKNSDSDDSATSKSIFNRSSFQKIASEPPNTRFNLICSEQISSASLHDQQSEIIHLQKVINDLNNQLNHVKPVINSVPYPPHIYSRPNSVHDCLPEFVTQQYADSNQSNRQVYIQHLNEIFNSRSVQTSPLYHPATIADANQTRMLHEALHKLSLSLEYRNTQIDDLKKEITKIRHFQSNMYTNFLQAPAPSKPITTPLCNNSHTSPFTPMVTAAKLQATSLATNTLASTSFMPFTMSLAHNLPTFSGKECEMPTKFITEFELRATSLVGYNDDYLLRAVQQSLSETALT
ncbi:unnamed protein product, partial [Rotaria magnacalcarata]